MYWRVRKITPEQVVKQYAPYIALGLSLFVNVVLIATRPSTPKVSTELRLSAESFCKQVTQHLLDTSYISYMDSSTALLSELAPPVIENLKAQGLIAKSNEDLRAQARTLVDRREVASVKITDVVVHDPQGQNPLSAVDVKGIVAIHSSQDSSATEPVNFYFTYMVGRKSGANGQPEVVNGNPVLLVADFKDRSAPCAESVSLLL